MRIKKVGNATITLRGRVANRNKFYYWFSFWTMAACRSRLYWRRFGEP